MAVLSAVGEDRVGGLRGGGGGGRGVKKCKQFFKEGLLFTIALLSYTVT